jgi:hypothetical protein
LAGIGKISYSLYLWHWPVFCFFKIWLHSLPGISYLYYDHFELIRLSLILISFILAVFSYYLIERPVRSRRILTAKSRLFLYSAAIALFLLASGLLIRWGEGFPKRIGAAVRAYEAGARDRVAGYDERPVLTYGQKHIPRLIGEKEKKPSFWIWGDSWAISWAEAIEELADEYEVSGRESAMPGCRPVYDINNSYNYPQQKDTADGCRIMNDAALELIEKSDIRHIVIIAFYGTDIDRSKGADSENGDQPAVDGPAERPGSSGGRATTREVFTRLVKELTKNGKTVWALAPVPRYAEPVPELLVKAVKKGDPIETLGMKTTQFERSAAPVMEMYHEAEKYGLRILPISPKICGGDYCALADRRGSFYMDDYHLSVYGTRYFRDSLRPVFEEISRR